METGQRDRRFGGGNARGAGLQRRDSVSGGGSVGKVDRNSAWGVIVKGPRAFVRVRVCVCV